MIEIIKERSISAKEIKDRFKGGNTSEISKVTKFTSSVLSARNSEKDMTVFLGLTNGNIIKLSYSKQKNVTIELFNVSSFKNMKMSLFSLVKKSLSTKEMSAA